MTGHRQRNGRGQGAGRGRSATLRAGAGVFGVLVLVGCTSSADSAGGSKPLGTKESAAPTEPAKGSAQVTFAPASGTTSIRPDKPIAVNVSDGTLDEVTVKDSKGEAISGKLAADKTSWSTSDFLRPKRTYTVTAKATGEDGEATTKTATLTTLTPSKSASFYFSPQPGATVGVGMPIAVGFADPVTESKRAAIEDRMKVTTTPATKGSWGWLTSTSLVWRPAEYWKPGTKVSVKADIGGMQTQETLWTSGDDATNFTVGSQMISTVNLDTKQMTVQKNGSTIKTIPISAGKSGFITRSGIKIIHSRESKRKMNSETTGIAQDSEEGYLIDVKYAMRLTNSGEFIHGAPWNASKFGVVNGSHGCTGMSDENAKWVFDNSKVGDVVKYTGSDRGIETGNGYSMWNMSFSEWQKQSAKA